MSDRQEMVIERIRQEWAKYKDSLRDKEAGIFRLNIVGWIGEQTEVVLGVIDSQKARITELEAQLTQLRCGQWMPVATPKCQDIYNSAYNSSPDVVCGR